MRSIPTFATLASVDRDAAEDGDQAPAQALEAEGLGVRLRLARKLRRLTQAELGAMIGRGPDAVGSYERGERKLPVDAVGVLCRRLGIDTPWLLTGQGEPPDDQAAAPNRIARPESPKQNRIAVNHGPSPADEARLHAAIAQIPVQVATQWVACPHCSLTGLRRQHLPVHFLSGNCIQRWEEGDLLEMTMAAQVDPEPWELAMVEAQKKIERSREMIKAAGLNLKKRAAWKKAYELNLQLLETIDANGPENYRHGHARLDGGAF